MFISKLPQEGLPPWDMKQIYNMPTYSEDDFTLDLTVEAISELYYKKENMKKRVYQYMVVLHEYEEDKANPKGGPVYKDSKVIIDMKTVMAKSEKELIFKITREIPEEFTSEPDNVEIMIRPF